MKQAKVRRKLELQTKDVDVNEAGEWLEAVVQVQEMALGRANTKENPEQEKPYIKSSKTKKQWFQKKKDGEMKLMQIQELKKTFCVQRRK